MPAASAQAMGGVALLVQRVVPGRDAVGGQDVLPETARAAVDTAKEPLGRIAGHGLAGQERTAAGDEHWPIHLDHRLLQLALPGCMHGRTAGGTGSSDLALKAGGAKSSFPAGYIRQRGRHDRRAGHANRMMQAPPTSRQ
jgi:hypothetical protein